MNLGTVKWFSADQGFGIITNDANRKNFFVHFSGIISDGFQSLTAGQKVRFDLQSDTRNTSKTQAVNVCVV